MLLVIALTPFVGEFLSRLYHVRKKKIEIFRKDIVIEEYNIISADIQMKVK